MISNSGYQRAIILSLFFHALLFAGIYYQDYAYSEISVEYVRLIPFSEVEPLISPNLKKTISGNFKKRKSSGSALKPTKILSAKAVDPNQTKSQTSSPDIILPKSAPLPESSKKLSDILETTKKFRTKSKTNVLSSPPASQEVIGALSDLEQDLKISAGKSSTNASISRHDLQYNLSIADAELYRQQLNALIIDLWRVPPQLTDMNLTVVVHFKVEKSGKIITTRIEKYSGNTILDNSVEKLLEDLSFLPPLPEVYPKHFYEFGIRFNPRQFQF